MSYPFPYGDFANPKRGGSPRPHHRRHPRGWCKDLEIMIVDGNSSDRTRKSHWRRTSVSTGTRKGTVVPIDRFDVAKRHHRHDGRRLHLPCRTGSRTRQALLDDDLDFILRPFVLQKTGPCRPARLGNWVLSFTARMLFWYGIKTPKRACGCSESRLKRKNAPHQRRHAAE